MRKYKNIARDSGVTAFEIGSDYIKVKFRGPEIYIYNYINPGRERVEIMKSLALEGRGLSTFISQEVRDDYYSKV